MASPIQPASGLTHPSPKRKRAPTDPASSSVIQPLAPQLMRTDHHMPSQTRTPSPTRALQEEETGRDSPSSLVAQQFAALRLKDLIKSPALDFSTPTATHGSLYDPRKRVKHDSVMDLDEDESATTNKTPSPSVGIPVQTQAGQSILEIAETPQRDARPVENISARAPPPPQPVLKPLDMSEPALFLPPCTNTPRPRKNSSPPPPAPTQEVEPRSNPLTWQDNEITGHLGTDPDDDGTGINGIGFRPTPAIAYARAQRRRQQLSEWRAREAREARQRRSERRALGLKGLGAPLERAGGGRRSVRFA